MADYLYDQTFHTYTMHTAMASAQRMIKLVSAIVPVTSVLDVGCSQGSWLKVWNETGVQDITGLDGDYVNPEKLLFDKTHFIPWDLKKQFQLGRKFDLVQCLEVAEHLPDQRAAGLVADLVAHASMVVFSAAPPGQGGENHINEQPYEYWAAHFARHDYVLVDCLRPVLGKWSEVAAWYKYNSFLFVHKDALEILAPYVHFFIRQAGEAIADVSPLRYQLQKAIIRLLPFGVQQFLAKLKAKIQQ